MAVTMIEQSIGTTTYKAPKLHKIVYATRTADNWTGKPSYLDPKFYEMEAWLKENCQHPYYHGGAWERDSFIEFECDEDAMMFALKWV